MASPATSLAHETATELDDLNSSRGLSTLSTKSEDTNTDSRRRMPVHVPTSADLGISAALKPTVSGETLVDASAADEIRSPESVQEKPTLTKTEDYVSPIPLLLPTDALHGVASFLSPSDWAQYGQVCRSSNRTCREVFRRVRMHAFRCATEVITAWKLGEHSDARELTALYIKAGVPIYPQCLGHSYHTLTWRMGVEAREIQNHASLQDNVGQQNEETTELTATASNTGSLDRFYSERFDTRTLNPALTYLEEKSVFWFGRDADSPAGIVQRLSMSSRINFAPPPPPVLPAHDAGAVVAGGAMPLPGFRPGPQQDAEGAHEMRELLPPGNACLLSAPSSFSEGSSKMPKLSIKAHKHLVDQHNMGHPSVDDENGAMLTPQVNLSADFFHPHFPSTAAAALSNMAIQSRSVGGTGSPDEPVTEEMWLFPPGGAPPQSDSDSSGDEHEAARASPLPEAFVNSAVTSAQASMTSQEAAGESASSPHAAVAGDSETATDCTNESQFETPNRALESTRPFSPPAPPLPPGQQDELLESPPPLPRPEPSLLTNVDLQVYTCASHGPTEELKTYLRMRFAVYQRQLDAMLVNLDSLGFEERLLDFWDEFFPMTAGIHYFDRYTAVPRLSKLQNFLTQPCPKAVGIVQCEIERIRTSSKKGVNVKGRLFPTYEYRLFIRDRRNPSSYDDASTDGEHEVPRRDTVLMSAKNRGKKHMDAAGMIPAPGSSRKGVNNYYMYSPQQDDVDSHYKAVNPPQFVSDNNPNGAYSTTPPPSAESPAPGMLGRLQSNFIGTEFQIFSPMLRKMPVKSSTVRSASGGSVESDNELDYDSGVCSDNPSTSSIHRRRHRFSRRAPKNRRRNEFSDEHPDPTDEDIPRPASIEKRSLKRSGSWPVISYGRSSRTSRRAIAHAIEGDARAEGQQYRTVFCEEEEGAITYTANLLGNRPRIMDVCIPRVSTDGVAGLDWKRYLASCDDGDSASANRMLTRFKQLQQRPENPDSTVSSDIDADEEPSSETDKYIPPDDFGLLALQNRPPWWNVELGAFVLNFGGRVNVASVKNFQLCDRTDQEHVMLQFGRIQGRHSFTMDFQHPLTAVQAFAIAISSLQSKISFG